MSHVLDGVPQSLLTVANPKMVKGEKLGYQTAILHLSPHKGSGVANVCSHASPGCIAACLNTAGRGGMDLDEDGLNVIQAARIRRTRYFKSNRDEFMAQLITEITKHVKIALKNELIPCVRLNGTSDLPWENIKVQQWNNVFALFPNLQFYDYTKVPIRLRQRALELNNYSLSFSLSENNKVKAEEAAAAGINVVAVFARKRSEDLPKKFLGRPVIDGDLSDLRFLDPQGVIVGLRSKGRGKVDTTGFVQP